ncbi:MAG: hypothetical protein LBI44_05650 [Oscillospiraceae bacterium]|jgi:hypothetical protein|nr:hypothetical protein [Oscillospiraceae bacterium]
MNQDIYPSADPRCPHCGCPCEITPDMLSEGSLLCPGCSAPLTLDILCESCEGCPCE